MILIHLCSTVQRLHMKKILKPVKDTRKESSVDISNSMTNRYIRCAIDTDHNKHYVYTKTVKFLNHHFQLTLEMVCNICMYHLRATLTTQ